MRSDPQQRIEATAFGRGAISAFIAVTLAFSVATNLPSSQLRQDLMRPGQPYLNALGLDQNWSVFAPDPRRTVIDLRAIVRFDDGSKAVWRIPENDPVVGGLRDYRWRKWMENAIQDGNEVLWRPAALWAAKHVHRRRHGVVEVRLVRRLADLLPPGQSPSLGPWRSETFYTLVLPGGAR